MAVLTATAVPLASARVAQDVGPPADEALNRYALLSLAGRAGEDGGIEFPVGDDGSAEPYATGPSPDSPTILPPAALRSGSGTLYAVGDSVLLGAEPYLRTTLTGWDVRLDGRVSRPPGEGFDLIDRNVDRIGDVLVVLLGHNCGCGAFASQLDDTLRAVSDVQRVVLVTVAEWSPNQPAVNRVIRDAGRRHPNVVVADWQAVSAANPQFLRGDRVHLSRSGAIALANLIAVMVGPAPSRNGVVPPRPRLLAIPDESASGSGGAGSSTGGSSGSVGGPSTSRPSSSASTTTPASTPPTTSTPPSSASSTPSTSPPTSTPSSSSSTSTTAGAGVAPGPAAP
jgi:hypothetical protein